MSAKPKISLKRKTKQRSLPKDDSVKSALGTLPGKIFASLSILYVKNDFVLNLMTSISGNWFQRYFWLKEALEKQGPVPGNDEASRSKGRFFIPGGMFIYSWFSDKDPAYTIHRDDLQMYKDEADILGALRKDTNSVETCIGNATTTQKLYENTDARATRCIINDITEPNLKTARKVLRKVGYTQKQIISLAGNRNAAETWHLKNPNSYEKSDWRYLRESYGYVKLALQNDPRPMCYDISGATAQNHDLPEFLQSLADFNPASNPAADQRNANRPDRFIISVHTETDQQKLRAMYGTPVFRQWTIVGVTWHLWNSGFPLFDPRKIDAGLEISAHRDGYTWLSFKVYDKENPYDAFRLLEEIQKVSDPDFAKMVDMVERAGLEIVTRVQSKNNPEQSLYVLTYRGQAEAVRRLVPRAPVYPRAATG